MSLWDLFDSPVYDEHDPLVLGWSDDQLEPVVNLLDARLPDGLTRRMRFAVAACALALVQEKMLSGNPLRYARAKDAYRIPKRYRTGGRYQTWHCVTKAMDILLGLGLIGHALGVWCPGASGHQSVAWATDDLVRLMGPVVDRRELEAPPITEETIILRDREDKREIDYHDTVETEAMRAEVGLINQALSELHLLHQGERFRISPARRIFNGDFSRGGRLYCQGPSFQNILKRQRRTLQMDIEAEMHPMVEIDFSTMHTTMAYAEAQERMPRGDPYAIEGFDRNLVKVAMNTMLNAPTPHLAVSAVEEELHANDLLRTASGLPGKSRKPCWELARKVVAAIEAKHWRIKSYFGSDCGSRFQRRDSDMAVQIMLRMIERTGRAPLPLHDSFLVADIDADILAQTMTEVADENGLELDLKDSGGRRWTAGSRRRRPTPTTAPFHMEVTNSDMMEVTNSDMGIWRKAEAGRTVDSARMIEPVGVEFVSQTVKGRGEGRDPPRVEIDCAKSATICLW